MSEGPRQTGRTRAQMEYAPEKAVFVWCNSELHYPRCLAVDLKRFDLEIVRPSWLESTATRGRKISAIILDHACKLTDRQRAYYRELKKCVSS